MGMKILKLLAVCVLCILIITGLVLLIQKFI
jgi:cytochrome b subunit of formate dehydrogenase